ncbi:Mannosylglycerate hydrolase [Listeria monocytogenes N53-1]|nr:Mannosylglycerate hydrolase [Listeria monocytogenes N53-1]
MNIKLKSALLEQKCVSDPVAEDILHRMKEADELCDSIENTIVKKIADDLSLAIYMILTDIKKYK